MPVSAALVSLSTEIIEIVQVVEPELGLPGVVPVGCLFQGIHLTHDFERRRTKERGLARYRLLPIPFCSASWWCGGYVRDWSPEPMSQPPIDLYGAHMAHGVKIKPCPGQRTIAPVETEWSRFSIKIATRRRNSMSEAGNQSPAAAMSMLRRPTSINSSNWIGEAPPWITALTNAAAHADCPLSCLHNLILRKPGQP